MYYVKVDCDGEDAVLVIGNARVVNPLGSQVREEVVEARLTCLEVREFGESGRMTSGALESSVANAPAVRPGDERY